AEAGDRDTEHAGSCVAAAYPHCDTCVGRDRCTRLEGAPERVGDGIATSLHMQGWKPRKRERTACAADLDVVAGARAQHDVRKGASGWGVDVDADIEEAGICGVHSLAH